MLAALTGAQEVCGRIDRLNHIDDRSGTYHEESRIGIAEIDDGIACRRDGESPDCKRQIRHHVTFGEQAETAEETGRPGHDDAEVAGDEHQ